MKPDPNQAPKGQVAIKKRSRVPGVMITQYVEEIPKGKTTPDFSRKPMPVNIQQGKSAIFKAMVTGDPAPTVSWARNKGEVTDTEKYKTRYEERCEEHLLEILNVTADQVDTYKCVATNEYGTAVCTATLNVIGGGFKKQGIAAKGEPTHDFRKMLKKTVVVPRKKQVKPKKEGEIDPKLWEVLMGAPKKDYEKICMDFGVYDFRFMLKRLNQLKKEREEEQAKVVEGVGNVKQVEVKPNGNAEFELDMTLKDPNSAILLYKDGMMVPYDNDKNSKHSLTQDGTKYIFSIKDPQPDDAGFYQVDVGDANVLATDLQIPEVEFVGKINDVKATEREDAVFQCVLSTPLGRINWSTPHTSLEQGDKYDITVSEDKLIHTLRVKDCAMADKGVYYAIAGIASSSASLTVEADPNSGKDRKAGGDDDLARLAKLQKEKDDLEAARKAQAEKDALAGGDGSGDGMGDGRDGSGDGGDGVDKNKKDGADGGDGSDKLIGLGITIGLSDVYAIRSQPADLIVKMNIDGDGAWFKDGEQLTTKPGHTITKDAMAHKLTIENCQDEHSGLYRFVSGDHSTQGKLTVGDVPEFDPDDLLKFAKPVIVKAGQNATFKMPFPPQDNVEVLWFQNGVELKDGGGAKIVKEPNHTRLLLRDCLRTDTGEIKLQLKTPFGTVEAISQLIVLDRPCPPEGPVEIVETTSSVIETKWNPPKDDGGCPVTNYIIQRQQVGQSLWTKLGDVSADKTTYRDRNVIHGKKYNYQIFAENPEGLSDALETTDSIMAGIMILAGPPGTPTVVSASKTCINLTWTAPLDDRGEPIIGYQLEKRKKDTTQWVALNQLNEPIEGEKYAVKQVTGGSEYEFRVSAINKSGAGDLSPPSAMVCAKNPNLKPCFKDPEDFIVVRAGNSVRVKINYEAEPPPEISWLKDNEPISPWVRVINTEGTSQLVVPNSKHSDSAIYTIKAKNSMGESSFNIEVRVTDEPKSPGPVALEQTVQGKVVISWAPSPDQELDDRLFYVVAQYDSETRIWKNVGDRLFTNTYTAINISPGREYHFRVFAKNDMGLSEPSESPTWGINSNRVQMPPSGSNLAEISFERPPSVLVPLKAHTPPKGYQHHMTCAIRGCPTPTVTWYLNNICINSDSNYYITNAVGVCSMYILRVQAKDSGEYKVVAVNSFGRAECSTKLVVRD